MKRPTKLGSIALAAMTCLAFATPSVAQEKPMRFYSFQIVIEKEAAGEGYYAYSPTLPGCFSNGKTIEAAKGNIRQAVEQHLESLLRHAQPIPQDDTIVHVEELSVGVPE